MSQRRRKPKAAPVADVYEYDVDDLYARFLRGAQLPDDSDDDYQPVDCTESSDSSDDAEDDDGRDALTLYSDLTTSQVGDEVSAPEPQVLLAHMSSPGRSGALTRRRYSRLLRQDSPSGTESWDMFVEQRRKSTSSRRSSL